MDTSRKKSFPRRRMLGAALAMGLTCSCVTQRQYEEAVALATNYQTQLHDLEAQMARLQSENSRLSSQVRRNEAAVLEAGFSESVTSRMSELAMKLDSLDRPLKDIERFDVEGGYVYMIQSKVLFDSGSDEVNPDGKAALLELAGNIRSAPHGRIFVRGHTDSDPVSRPETIDRFPRGNLELSSQRAVAVASLLTQEGSIDAKDVVTSGYGQWEPVAENDSADNKRLNRRVEIFVADQE